MSGEAKKAYGNEPESPESSSRGPESCYHILKVKIPFSHIL